MCMRPNQQFINMINAFFLSRQKEVTSLDYKKHYNETTTFYIMSEVRMENLKSVYQTELFSDQKLIEISENAETFMIGNNISQREYKKTSPMKLENYQGNSFLHWKVESPNREQLTVIKLMSPDGCVQFKLMSADQKTQWVYNVCELPS